LSASSKRLIRWASAPVNAPRSWPNNSLSRRPSGDGGAIHSDECVMRPGTEIMYHPGDKLLARACLPKYEDSALRERDSLAPREHVSYPAALADNLQFAAPVIRPVESDGFVGGPLVRLLYRAHVILPAKAIAFIRGSTDCGLWA
jgi:hypothetical protein